MLQSARKVAMGTAQAQVQAALVGARTFMYLMEAIIDFVTSGMQPKRVRKGINALAFLVRTHRDER